ncbi:MAG TPA: PspC domain-containing protein [Acidimicrobiales bacterium]|nr:PspC domain-containing protein [Acidimicrobiales bacterium]
MSARAGARQLRGVVRPAGATELRRPCQDRAIAGVAHAVASRTGVSPLAAQFALLALTLFGGAGIALYLAGWLCIPLEGEDRPLVQAALSDHRTLKLVGATASALVALMAGASVLGSVPVLGAVAPGLVSLSALIAVWRHAGPEDRASMERLFTLATGAGTPGAPAARRLLVGGARIALGAGLIALGTSTVLAPTHLNGADIEIALAALGVVAGSSIILAPWWLRVGRDLAGERRQRARAEERAEMAAHLHDSVLQTLALIQRSAGDPQQVQRLARAQERQLRSWLFDKPSANRGPETLSSSLAALQQEVEADHGLRTDVVTVGDAVLDETLSALLAATREAVVNAAKWSGADVVSIYAEVEQEAISVFVRDRGCGFDPAQVGPDRKGLSDSVYARMHRNGGTAAVRSAPGQGTEVELSMPRRAA